MSDQKPIPTNGAATTFIYALLDPQTREIRYIGKADKPGVRFQRHINDVKRGDKSYKANWIRSLLAKGLRPVFRIIDEVLKTEWQAAEAAYIAVYREEGCRLVNTHPGGEGPGSGIENPFFGRKHSAETAAKMSVAATKRGPPKIDNAARSRGQKHYLFGKHLLPETKEKLSAALSGEKHPSFGKPVPAERRAKISASLKGDKHFWRRNKMPPEMRAKMSASQKGRIFTPEHRRKLSEAARLAQRGHTVSLETRMKISVATKGKYCGKQHSAESLANMRAAQAKKRKRIYTVLGMTAFIDDLCKKLNVNKSTVAARLKRGWHPDRAFSAAKRKNQYA